MIVNMTSLRFPDTTFPCWGRGVHWFLQLLSTDGEEGNVVYAHGNGCTGGVVGSGDLYWW